MKFIGGMYAVALPTAEYAVLYPTQPDQAGYIESLWGRIDLPGFDIIEFDIHASGKIAGKAQREPDSPDRGTWLWRKSTGEWEHVNTSAHGTYPCIFAKDGTLVQADSAQHGSQGFRYVAEDGRLVSGDDTLNDQRRVGLELGLSDLWEYSHFAGVTIGQGDPPMGCHVLIDGTRRMLEPGGTHFIRVKYAQGVYAISMTKLAENVAVIHRKTRAELLQLPLVTPIDVTPAPVDPPSPTPEPTMPDSLFSLVQEVFQQRLGHLDRPANNDECAAVMNEVAWKANGQKPEPWGLSAKPGGNNAAQPKTGTRVAYDILQYKPDLSLWDALGPSEDPKPTWGEAHPHNDPNRPWVPAVQPDGLPDPGPILPTPHVYDGGDNDTGTCDICGQPRAATVHVIVPAPNTELEKRVAFLEQRLQRLENAGLLVAQVYRP